jgi:hypothetical protein
MNDEVRVVGTTVPDHNESADVVARVDDQASVTQPTKRQRVLSDKQLAALSKGREKRWLQRQQQEQKAQGDVEEDNEDDTIPDPPQLKRESKPQYVDSNDYTSEDSEPSPPRPEPEQWSSSEEEDEEFKMKLRQREARRSIPRNIRKQIDIYVDKKLEESKQNKYLPPPFSARDQESSYSRDTFTPLYM